MRIMQNNSGLWCQRKTTQFYLETELKQRAPNVGQIWSRGHFCRLP